MHGREFRVIETRFKNELFQWAAVANSAHLRAKIVLAVASCVVVVIVAMAAFALHHVDRYLPRMIGYIQKQTGLQIEIKHATVGLFPLTVRLYGLGIKNPKPFPPGYFLQAPTVEAAMHVGALLHRKIEIKSLVLDHPTIDFISDPDGLWNFQNPAGLHQPAQEPVRFSMGPIAKLQIEHGVLIGSTLIDPADTPGPVILKVQNFSARFKQLNFDAFKVPSTVVTCSLEADAAQFGDIHLKDLHSQVRMLPDQFTFKNFDAKTYRGKASGDFTLNFAGNKTHFQADLQVTGVGISYLLAEFEKGPAQMKGMMQADFKLSGEVEHTSDPFASITGGGHFTIRKGELPSLNGNKNMDEMKRFRNPAGAALPASAFSSFTGELDMRNHRIYNKQIGVDFYGIDVDGSGSLDELNGGMNYTGVATILKKQGLFTNVAAKLFKGADEKKGRLTFPIRIVGTLQNPQFSIVK